MSSVGDKNPNLSLGSKANQNIFKVGLNMMIHVYGDSLAASKLNKIM